MLSGNSTVSNVEVGLGKPNFMLERPSWNTCVSIYRYSIPFLPSSFSMPLRNSNAQANPLFTTLIILKLYMLTQLLTLNFLVETSETPSANVACK